MDQYYLKIGKDARISEPITIEGTGRNGSKIELRIEMGAGARADLIERWEGVGTAKIDFALDLKAEPHSQVRYVALQSEGRIEQWREHRQTHAAEGAQVRLFLFHFGAQSVISQTEQNAQGRAAHIETWITSRRRERQTMLLSYQHRFHERNGSGKAHLQGVALNESRLEMNGKIAIGANGGGTDTHLEVKALNLSPKAEVKALPGLEVDTNDVKAGHSAAVQHLNPEQWIYAQSRGLSAEEAKRLMIEGFLKKGLQELKDLPEPYEKIKGLI